MKNRDELKQILDENILKLLPSLKKDTHEWYLHNHLVKYRDALELNNDSSSLDKAARKFSHYCTESMDWDTDEYKKYTEIAQIGIKISKKEKHGY